MRTGLAIALAVIVADQATKEWMLGLVFDPPRRIELLPVLDLVPVWNRGVSFGLFNSGGDAAPYLLAGLSIAVAVGLAIWMRRATGRRLRLGLALVVGGALGNVVDRFRFGAVVDFIDVHWGGWHWPAFNVADSAITVGVLLVVLDSLIEPRERAKEDIGETAATAPSAERKVEGGSTK